MARLYREHANVQAAPGLLPDRARRGRAGLRIAMHVWSFYCWNTGYVSEGRYRLGQLLARVADPTVWRAQALLLASLLAALGGDGDAAVPLLEQGSSLARQLNDPVTSAFAAYCAGVVSTYAGDLHQAIAHLEDALAALPATAVHARQHPLVLISLTTAAGLAGEEERAAARQRELSALSAVGGELTLRWHSAYLLWALGLPVWRGGDLDPAAGLQAQALRLKAGHNDRPGVTYCLEALAWLAGSEGQHERAAVLLGAGSLRRPVAMTLDGYQRRAGYQEDCERRARQALGGTAFQAAYTRGLELPAEDALAYALHQPPAPG